MIYLDSSVALAHLFSENRIPSDELWSETLSSSRLLEYEIWTQINSRKLSRSHGVLARELIGQVALVDLTPQVLARALEPFPVAVRTLDALHLASIEFQRSRGHQLELASYDNRLNAAAAALHIPLYKF